jgi:hypothetical protein
MPSQMPLLHMPRLPPSHKPLLLCVFGTRGGAGGGGISGRRGDSAPDPGAARRRARRPLPQRDEARGFHAIGGKSAWRDGNAQGQLGRRGPCNVNAIFCHRAFPQSSTHPMPTPLYLPFIAAALRGTRGGRIFAYNTTRHTHLCTRAHAITCPPGWRVHGERKPQRRRGTGSASLSPAAGG